MKLCRLASEYTRRTQDRRKQPKRTWNESVKFPRTIRSHIWPSITIDSMDLLRCFKWLWYIETPGLDIYKKVVLKGLFEVSPFLFGKVILIGESDPYWFFTGTYLLSRNKGKYTTEENNCQFSKIQLSESSEISRKFVWARIVLRFVGTGRQLRSIPCIGKYLRAIPLTILIPFTYVRLHPSVDNTT